MRPEDPRFWILNPTGHRLAESRQFYGKDGDMVDTVFGEAVLIVPPQPAASDWYCDICSEIILTRWGDEPFPVPMFSSYALCAEHFYEFQEGERDDPESGEPIPGSKWGLWPMMSCGCQACRQYANGYRAVMV